MTRCFPDDSVSTFYSIFFLMTPLFWGNSPFSVVCCLKKQKNKLDQKSGSHTIISCTGIDYTGRSLFSIALDSVTMDL